MNGNKKSQVKFVNGSSEIVNGEVRLFYPNEMNVSLSAVPGINYFNINNVLSVKPIDTDGTVINKKNYLYDGMKINKTALNIRSVIIENRIEHLKNITPEQMEMLVQLFEKENKSKVNLSNFSTTDLIEALGIRDDVSVAKMDSEVYKVEIDLFKAKKYTIVEKNCDVELEKRQRTSLNKELRIFAGQ